MAREWTRIGVIGFGGPPAHIALLRRLVVVDRQWLDAETFEDANAACSLLPGPSSTQLAMLCAHRVAGAAGTIVGGLSFIAPAVILVLIGSSFLLSASAPTWLEGAGAGAGAAVGSVALRAAIELAGPSRARARGHGGTGRRWFAYLLAGSVTAFFLGSFLVLVLLACGAIEYSVERRRRPPRQDTDRHRRWAATVGSQLLASGGTGALAWTALKVGALSFGGGFVIVPLMQGDAVHVNHWMTGGQFLDAVALGQVTPGPVVATVTAVGYAAGGVGGALLAAAVAFVPSFAFVLGGARRFEQLRLDPGPRAFLDGAGPAAIGAILGASVTLATTLTQAWQFAILGASAIALLGWRASVPLTLVVAALLGAVAALAGAPLPT